MRVRLKDCEVLQVVRPEGASDGSLVYVLAVDRSTDAKIVGLLNTGACALLLDGTYAQSDDLGDVAWDVMPVDIAKQLLEGVW